MDGGFGCDPRAVDAQEPGKNNAGCARPKGVCVAEAGAGKAFPARGKKRKTLPELSSGERRRAGEFAEAGCCILWPRPDALKGGLARDGRPVARPGSIVHEAAARYVFFFLFRCLPPIIGLRTGVADRCTDQA